MSDVDLTRRSFLGGMLAVAGATVVPVSKLFENLPRIMGDGIHDDTAGLQAAIEGNLFICDGLVVRNAQSVHISQGTYRLTKTLLFDNAREVSIIGVGPDRKKFPTLYADHDGHLLTVINKAYLHLDSMNLSGRGETIPICCEV